MIDNSVDIGKTVDDVVAAVKATLDDVLSKRDEVRLIMLYCVARQLLTRVLRPTLSIKSSRLPTVWLPMLLIPC